MSADHETDTVRLARIERKVNLIGVAVACVIGYGAVYLAVQVVEHDLGLGKWLAGIAALAAPWVVGHFFARRFFD